MSLLLSLLLLLALAGRAAADERLVEVTVPDRATLDAITSEYDVAHTLTRNDDGTFETEVVVDDEETTALKAMGIEFGEVIEDASTHAARLAERDKAIAAEERALEAAESGSAAGRRRALASDVVIQRADTFTNYAGSFVYAEARSSEGTTDTGTMAMSWNTGEGTEFGTAVSMDKFNDAGQYMYHRYVARIPDGTPMPTQVRIASSFGGVEVADTEEWLGGGLPSHPDGYLTGFHTRYMDPTEVKDRFEAIADEFPDIAEMVTMPHQTNGYRRKAMGIMHGTGDPGEDPNGAAESSAVSLTTDAWGHEGGNDVWVEFVTGAAGSPLSIAVDGSVVTVTLATDAGGAPTSTAAQVVAAINADAAASAILDATTFRGDAGAGIVEPRELVRLSDYLTAPASVSREPFSPALLRIGKDRDGSKTGVFMYCQQHAREWVTPLTCLETAERLVRNYGTDPATKELVDNLDIFIVPSVNPDGSHFSMYDENFQRRNMTNHCGPDNSDADRRDDWGVDLNRNSTVGTVFDGYDGASLSCTSDVFAGPSEGSEPEIQNELWVVDAHSNIKFAINIHSHGGYFMWSPGAYIAEGRVTLPAPNIGVEEYFWQAADKILNRIKDYRGTVIVPERTGPIADVLYSAAGNSADDQWYRKGIISYSFEVGAQIYDPEEDDWDSVGFQPDYSEEGRHEAMEFANGNYGLLESALDYSRDDAPPETRLVYETDHSEYPIEVTFDWVNEASVIHYTTDGSTPTTSSPKWEAQGPRQPGEVFTFDQTTTLRWIAVDIKGNQSAIQSHTFIVESNGAPVTTATLSPAEGDGWDGSYVSPVTVTLSAAPGDSGSPVDRTEYRLNGGDWTEYTGPVTVSDVGWHRVDYRSVDEAGNVEEAKFVDFLIAPLVSDEASVGGDVPSTLGLSVGPAASFGTFVPGVAEEYETTLAASVTSTSDDAVLSVRDPSSHHTGHLTNGEYALANPLGARVDSGFRPPPFQPIGGARTQLERFDEPLMNEPVTVELEQEIEADEVLRSGRYGKTLVFELSTTNP